MSFVNMVYCIVECMCLLIIDDVIYDWTGWHIVFLFQSKVWPFELFDKLKISPLESKAFPSPALNAFIQSQLWTECSGQFEPRSRFLPLLWLNEYWVLCFSLQTNHRNLADMEQNKLFMWFRSRKLKNCLFKERNVNLETFLSSGPVLSFLVLQINKNLISLTPSHFTVNTSYWSFRFCLSAARQTRKPKMRSLLRFLALCAAVYLCVCYGIDRSLPEPPPLHHSVFYVLWSHSSITHD